MKNYNVIYAVVFLLLLAPGARSQVTMTGGKGMLRLYEAETVTPGDVYVNPFGAFFATQVSVPGATFLAKDYTVNVGLTLGISRVFETFLHLTPYQTDQVHLWGPPGDAKIGLKINIPKSGVAQFGLAAFASFATAGLHPLPYEPYSEDAFGYAVIGLASFNFRHAVSPKPLKITLNLGYRSHNSSRGFFTGDTDQLIGGLGLKFPVKSSQLFTEVTGENFFNHSEVAFGQNSWRWSGGYKFIKRGIIFDIGGDIELGGYKPSAAEKNLTPRYWEDYADWKLVLGMTFRWTLFDTWNKTIQELEKQQQEQSEESEELRKKRRKVIEELEEYKKRLEEEKKTDVPF